VEAAGGALLREGPCQIERLPARMGGFDDRERRSEWESGGVVAGEAEGGDGLRDAGRTRPGFFFALAWLEEGRFAGKRDARIVSG